MEAWDYSRVESTEQYQKERKTSSTVLAILNNPFYLDKFVWNKKSNTDGKRNDVSEWIVAEETHP
jgi:hypothetical protein